MTQTLTVRRIATAILVVFMTMLAALMLWPSAASGTTFTVMNNADSGAGSLRAAITSANAFVGQRDTIDFDPSAFPSGAPATISVISALPASADPAGIVIDGSGAGVIIDGSALAGLEDGIVIQSGPGTDLSDVIVRNITIQNFPRNGVFVCGGDSAGGCSSELIDAHIQGVTSTGHGGIAIFVRGHPNTRPAVSNSEGSGSQAGIRVEATSPTDLVNALVEDSEVRDNAGDGLDVQGENLIGATVRGVTAENNAVTAINVASSEDNTDALITDSTATGVGTYGIDLYAGTNLINATVSNSSTSGGNYGIELYGDGNVGSRVTNSQASGAKYVGIQVYSFLGDPDPVIENVTASDNLDVGIGIDAIHGTVINASIGGCTANGNGGPGVRVFGEVGISSVEVANCTTSNNSIGVHFEGGGDVTNNTISSVTASGNTDTGLVVQSTMGENNGTTITRSELGSNNYGVIIEAITGGQDTVNPLVSDSLIHDNNTGILISGAGTVLGAEITSNTIVDNAGAGLFSEGADAHFNRIVGNNPGIDNTAMAPLQAQNNWWGCNEGPGMPGCDSTSGIGGVDADPWLVLGVAASGGSIQQGGMSDLAADVTMNSDAADTSGSGHIPDGTEIGFQTDLGSVGSKSTVKQTANGSAVATLSADEGQGTAHVTATLDNETVGASVTITGAPSSPTPSPTPGPTGTPPPAGELVQGDNDCDGDVDAVDALKGLQHVAAIPFQQADSCPEVGGVLPAAAPAGDPPDVFGDVDCDADVDAVDALKILQSVAAIPFTQSEPCTDIGDTF